MKHPFIALFIFALCFSACHNKYQSQNELTSHHIRIQGSKVYMDFPDGYMVVNGQSCFKKKNKTYIQLVETDGQSFTELSPKLTKENLTKQGLNIGIYERVKVGDYEAVYIDGPAQISGRSQSGLYFGDGTFTVAVMADYIMGEESNEIEKILESVYYDKAYNLNPLELANFTIDFSITGFKHQITSASVFIFSPHGTKDIGVRAVDEIAISRFPSVNGSDEVAKFLSDENISKQQNGIILQNMAFKPDTINGCPVQLLESLFLYEGNQGILYEAVYFGPNATLALNCTAYAHRNVYLPKFKQTAQTLKFKED